MKTHLRNYGSRYGVSASILAMALLVFVPAPKAQQANGRADAAASKPTPRMTDGHPDFTGFWLDNVAGISYANDAGASEDGNLTRLADGSTIFLYGGAGAGIPNSG